MNQQPHQTNVERDLTVQHLGEHLQSLKTLTEYTLKAAQHAEACSRGIGQESLANKLQAIEEQIVEVQRAITDSEIGEWIGPEMHVPF